VTKKRKAEASMLFLAAQLNQAKKGLEVIVHDILARVLNFSVASICVVSSVFLTIEK
jgi:hypothetical protein